MFHFFEKKTYLVDQLDGFVDIHNHILPGLDDGSPTLEDSIVLLEGFGDFGVTRFICTPHIMEGYYPNTPKTIKRAHAELEFALKRQQVGNIDLGYAAEHMIDGAFPSLLESGEIVPHLGTHLLIEMSYLQPSIHFDEAVSSVMSAGYFPVFAHPERYPYLYGTGKYSLYKDKGILFQMNLLSLGDFYGSGVQKAAIRLLEAGQVDFLGSDVHNAQQLAALKETKISKKHLPKIQRVAENTVARFSVG